MSFKPTRLRLPTVVREKVPAHIRPQQRPTPPKAEHTRLAKADARVRQRVPNIGTAENRLAIRRWVNTGDFDKPRGYLIDPRSSCLIRLKTGIDQSGEFRG